MLFVAAWLFGIILMSSVDNVIGRGARIGHPTNIDALGRPGARVAIKAVGIEHLKDIRCRGGNSHPMAALLADTCNWVAGTANNHT